MNPREQLLLSLLVVDAGDTLIPLTYATAPEAILYWVEYVLARAPIEYSAREVAVVAVELREYMRWKRSGDEIKRKVNAVISQCSRHAKPSTGVMDPPERLQ